MVPICARETIDGSSCSSSLEHASLSAASSGPKDDQPSDVPDSGTERGPPPVSGNGNGCVLDGEGRDGPENTGKSAVQDEEATGRTETASGKKASVEPDKKPVLIRMFKGSELDENFVYTDQDMVGLITRIVNENIDCFEIEEVQTATYERLRFCTDATKTAEDGWEEIVHKTPIQELFSMIEFLREQARDTLESVGPPTEPELVASKNEADEKTGEGEPGRTCTTTTSAAAAAAGVPAVATTGPRPDDLTLLERRVGAEEDAPVDAEKTPTAGVSVVAASPIQALGPRAECAGEPGGAQPPASSPKKHPGSRPKVAPLDLSKPAAATGAAPGRERDTPRSGQPTGPMSARLDGALVSPLTTAKLFEAVRPLEELYRRHGKDADKLERLLAACALDSLANCRFGRPADSPLGQESPAFADGPTSVY